MGRASGQHNLLAAANRGSGGQQSAARRWDDKRLRAELKALVEQLDCFPSYNQLSAMGREDLRCALKRNGGSGWWARELGVALGPGQDRSRYTRKDATRDAEAVIAELGYLPSTTRLRALGYPRLASYAEVRHRSPTGFVREVLGRDNEVPHWTEMRRRET